MKSGVLTEILTFLQGSGGCCPGKDFLRNEQQIQQIQAQSSEELKKTLIFLTEFGHLKTATDKLHTILDRAQEGKISYEDLRGSIQKLAGLSSEEMMPIYQLAHTFFLEKQFERAASIALFLSYINPEISIFWRMAGICYLHLQDMRSALAPFLYASMVNSLELDNHLAALHCLSQLGLMQETLHYYNVAKEVLSDAQQWDDVRELDLWITKL